MVKKRSRDSKKKRKKEKKQKILHIRDILQDELSFSQYKAGNIEKLPNDLVILILSKLTIPQLLHTVLQFAKNSIFSQTIQNCAFKNWRLNQTGVLDLLSTRTKGITFVRFNDDECMFDSILKRKFCSELLKRKIFDSKLRCIEFVTNLPITIENFWEQLFAACPNIDHIRINSQFASSAIKSFSKHAPLKYLDIRDCRESEPVDELSSLHNLESLLLGYSRSNDGFRSIFASNPNLKIFQTFSTYLELSELPINLERVSIFNGYDILPKLYTTMEQRKPNWKKLDLSHNRTIFRIEAIEDKNLNLHFENLSKNCPSLESIRLFVKKLEGLRSTVVQKAFVKKEGKWEKSYISTSTDWIIEDIPWYLR